MTAEGVDRGASAYRLDGKVALVIGAGGAGNGWSNGRAAAVVYSRRGARVVAADIAQDRADSTRDKIASEGRVAIALAGDATRSEDVRRMVEETVAAFGRIDVLHNNVGVGGGFGTPDTMAEEAWDREIEVTLKSAFLGIKHAVPHMKAQGEGVIVNISSIAAVRFLRKPLVGYSAAKAGVEALTRSCAVAYGPDNIRVNCVRVGFSETPILTLGLQKRGLSPEAIEEEMAKSRRKVPLRHEHTQPWDVANASAFLASDAARGITGVVMNVDGGVELAPI